MFCHCVFDMFQKYKTFLLIASRERDVRVFDDNPRQQLLPAAANPTTDSNSSYTLNTCKVPDTHPDIVSRHHLPLINITDFKIYIYTKPDGLTLMRLDTFNSWEKLK